MDDQLLGGPSEARSFRDAVVYGGLWRAIDASLQSDAQSLLLARLLGLVDAMDQTIEEVTRQAETVGSSLVRDDSALLPPDRWAEALPILDELHDSIGFTTAVRTVCHVTAAVASLTRPGSRVLRDAESVVRRVDAAPAGSGPYFAGLLGNAVLDENAPALQRALGRIAEEFRGATHDAFASGAWHGLLVSGQAMYDCIERRQQNSVDLDASLAALTSSPRAPMPRPVPPPYTGRATWELIAQPRRPPR